MSCPNEFISWHSAPPLLVQSPPPKYKHCIIRSIRQSLESPLTSHRYPKCPYQQITPTQQAGPGSTPSANPSSMYQSTLQTTTPSQQLNSWKLQSRWLHCLVHSTPTLLPLPLPLLYPQYSTSWRNFPIDILGSVAFTPVKNDILGNIKLCLPTSLPT